MLNPQEKGMERLRKMLAEVETDEDPDFDNEDNAPEDVLEEIFSDHESFCEHDTEPEEDGDFGNEDGNNLEQKLFIKIGHKKSGKKQKNLVTIFVLIIVHRAYLEQKDERKT
ncbi:hypothetical protein AVEN_150133-1 [Araneus ventricosus]|uniref:Uncharacterized protein n=1 Tax=Araneus ventricosus TaxID=182803 RepID=A0A4Y2PCS9_ARAVE|nr:hypothetical protein AVEN_150133-1 [Araneus ventricosus]